MKNIHKTYFLQTMMALLGILCCLLRTQLYATCLEPSGLLSPSPLETWLTVLTVLAVGAAALGSWQSRYAREARSVYPASKFCGWVCILAGALLLGSGLGFLGAKGWAQWALLALAVAAGPCLIHAGWKRLHGGRPEYLFQALVCICFMAVLTYEFRFRGHDPQIQDYAYQILALLSVSMGSFLRLCLDIQPAKQRFLAFCTYCGLFFSLVALSAGDDPLLYGAALLWCLSNQPQEDLP